MVICEKNHSHYNIFYHWYIVRLKDFSFKERSFTLELPKPLILADTLVSVLYPPFDHLTPLARYIHSRTVDHKKFYRMYSLVHSTAGVSLLRQTQLLLQPVKVRWRWVKMLEKRKEREGKREKLRREGVEEKQRWRGKKLKFLTSQRKNLQKRLLKATKVKKYFVK